MKTETLYRKARKRGVERKPQLTPRARAGLARIVALTGDAWPVPLEHMPEILAAREWVARMLAHHESATATARSHEPGAARMKRKQPTITVHVFRPSGFLAGPPLVRCDALTIPAPFRVTRRLLAGYAAGLRIVRALPDGAAFVSVVDSAGRHLAAWKPCAIGRYTGTHDAPPHFTEWNPAQ